MANTRPRVVTAGTRATGKRSKTLADGGRPGRGGGAAGSGQLVRRRQIVAKRQRRLSGIDELVISLTAKGLTTGEVKPRTWPRCMTCQVSKADDLHDHRPGPRRPVRVAEPAAGPRSTRSMFIDAIHVKIRDGSGRQPAHLHRPRGHRETGTRDILGMWAGEHGDGEGAKFWLRVLTDIKNRGTQRCAACVVCDGLKGLPDSVAAVWPKTVVQACVVHLLRNIVHIRLPQGLGRRSRRTCKPVYTAATEQAALDRFAEFSARSGKSKYPAIIRLWDQRVGRVRAVHGLRRGDQVRSSAPPTPSNRSTPVSVEQSTPGVTSRPNRPR